MTPLDALRSEAEAAGRPELAEAFRRLGLLAEVRECLAGESPDAAVAVSAFCDEAFDRLADDANEDAPSWVLGESSERWGDYLGLIDPAYPAVTEWPEEPPGPVDEPAAIDAGTLLRLLTGSPPAAPPTPEGPNDDPPPGPSARGTGDAKGDRAPRARIALNIPPPPTTLTVDSGLGDTFLAEAAELAERIEGLVLGLSGGGDHAGLLHELGRCFHTLKGAAGSVGLGDLASLVHATEEELEAARGEATDDLVGLLHRLLDYLDGVFQALRRGVQPPRPPAAEGPPSGPPKPAAEDEPGTGSVRVSSERIDELMDLASELIARRGSWVAQAEAMKAFAAQARTSRGRLLATLDRMSDLQPAGNGGRPAEESELTRRLAEQSDDLLVLIDAARSASKPLEDNSDALARLTLQIWDALQSTRIVPVRGLFQRLARVAHDAARVEGRRVEVVTVGDETGLDRAVQDKAFESLLHAVRNAVGHGIEPADARRRVGKPETGRVTLSASRAGHTLVLSVEDDGRGLDYEAIAARGRRLGLITGGDDPGLDRLNALVFRSGFSTRDQANEVSGRGVGMDVVAQEVGRLHGSVSLTSRAGLGTKLSVSLPARLALQQAVVVRVGGQAFGLPVEMVELVQPFEPEDADDDATPPRVRVRGDWVPLVDAREALGLSTAEAVSCPKLLLIRADGEALGVRVDSIEGTRELIIKPLGPLLSGHPVVSGVSLSATGEVVFAFDPAGIARRSVRQATRPGNQLPSRADPILVVDDSISVRKAVAQSLQALGYEVEEVADGIQALARVRGRSYGLIFSDLEMPRMDGFELLSELRRLETARGVPVVVASTRCDPETRRTVLGLGARAFLAKPIDPDLMASTVRELLGGRAVV